MMKKGIKSSKLKNKKLPLLPTFNLHNTNEMSGDPLELCNTMNSNETTEQNNCENEEPTFESYGTSTVSSHTSI